MVPTTGIREESDGMIPIAVAIITAFAIYLAWAWWRCSDGRERSKPLSENQTPPSLGPKSFLNHIKKTLPRGVGLIYEVKTSLCETDRSTYEMIGMDCEGDFMVSVHIIDPLSDDLLCALEFNERRLSKDFVTACIHDAVVASLKKTEAKEVAGITEIIS